MSKHTPGPWLAQHDPNAISRDDWCIGVEGASVDYVAVCSERDVRLIAAAPDLLKALRYVVAVYDNGTCGSVVEMAFDRARAAIAKAGIA